MLNTKHKHTICNVVISLFCLANVLELFIPRVEGTDYFVRMPIQLINGVLLILMWWSLFSINNHWNSVTKAVLLFIALMFVYTGLYILNDSFNISDFTPYIRLLVWTTSIIFFYEMLAGSRLNQRLISLYILTFIAAIAKKIFETPSFENEIIEGGDTASLPLLFILPLVLICFVGKYRYILIALISVLILFSLRRTAILGLIICLPFIYKYIRSSLRIQHFLFIALAFGLLINYVWSYVGDALIYRFENLLIGDSGGNKESFGSGRSDFYVTVLQGWLNGDWTSFLFGNGLVSVKHLLLKTNNVPHAHNDFLEIVYTFGLFGLSIWMIVLFYLWKLRKLIRRYTPELINIHSITIISYLIIGMASGCILRISTVPFALTLSLLLYYSRNVTDGEEVKSSDEPKHYIRYITPF